jgi:hypothetical protein
MAKQKRFDVRLHVFLSRHLYVRDVAIITGTVPNVTVYSPSRFHCEKCVALVLCIRLRPARLFVM